jgi:hypothetical protein
MPQKRRGLFFKVPIKSSDTKKSGYSKEVVKVINIFCISINSIISHLRQELNISIKKFILMYFIFSDKTLIQI